MNYLLPRNRPPIKISDADLGRVVDALAKNQRQIFLNGQIYDLMGLQSFKNFDDLEDFVGKAKGLWRCSFGNWHNRGAGACSCPDKLPAPLDGYDLGQNRLKPPAEKIFKKSCQ